MSRVLLIDDFSTVRILQRQALRQIDIHDVTEAENGADAIEVLRNNDFDLIITDWNMPEMSGFELLTKIRTINARLPVMMVTTNSNRDEVLSAIQAGVSGYVVKPFDREHYQKMVQNLIETAKKHAEQEEDELDNELIGDDMTAHEAQETQSAPVDECVQL